MDATQACTLEWLLQLGGPGFASGAFSKLGSVPKMFPEPNANPPLCPVLFPA
jgi:hypothetical protein